MLVWAEGCSQTSAHIMMISSSCISGKREWMKSSESDCRWMFCSISAKRFLRCCCCLFFCWYAHLRQCGKFESDSVRWAPCSSARNRVNYRSSAPLYSSAAWCLTGVWVCCKKQLLFSNPMQKVMFYVVSLCGNSVLWTNAIRENQRPGWEPFVSRAEQLWCHGLCEETMADGCTRGEWSAIPDTGGAFTSSEAFMFYNPED